MPIDREDFNQLRDDMLRGFAGLNTRLDTLNGRTRETETQLAVAKTQIAVLQDRSNREWWERLVSGGIGASLVGFGAFFKGKLGL